MQRLIYEISLLPAIVTRALNAIAKVMRAERRKLEPATKANPAFARRAELIDRAPGLAEHSAAVIVGWTQSSDASAIERPP
ncbi:MAG TPA: hypothetical protein VFE63_11075 [Roseiarcus sp.]|jgi:hypothetical protein|nr:hypothetical protein [Roseiarcus sp.]